MPRPVFISYARSASRAQAGALHEALGGETAFLDTSDIELRTQFPPELAKALLASRVVVVFASKEYFRRWYCLWELDAALAPFLALGPEASAAQKSAALAPLVIALPGQAGAALELKTLPPALRTTSWPRVDDVAALEALVRKTLGESAITLEQRLKSAGRMGAALQTRLLEESVLPTPKNLATVRTYPGNLLPSLGESFVGRADELWRIHYTLSVLRDKRGEGVTGAALTGALHAAGGFGKTRLALEFLHRLGPTEYPGGLFWVNADATPENLEEQFHGILKTLRPEVPDLVPFRESKRSAEQEMAKALEAEAARERILYVVDNVPEPGTNEAPKPLRTWCPALGKVALLATSRAKLDLGVEGVLGLPVAALAPEAAVALLTDAIPQSNLGAEGWRQIAEWVGHLPLALELLNRALRAGAIEPSELLLRARGQGSSEELDRQMEVVRPHVPAGSFRGVAEAFSLSYAKLSEAEQRAARLVAWLSPAPVPLSLFKALGPEVAAPAIKVQLQTRHFVVPVESSGDVVLFGSMHRVLADYLRNQAQHPAEELRHVTQGLVQVLSPDACRDSNEWPLMEVCLPHAQAVFEQWMAGRPFANAHSSSAGQVDHETHSQEVTVSALGANLAFFLLVRGFSRQANNIAKQTVERAREALGEEHPNTLRAMGSLASTLATQGMLEGFRESEQRMLEMRMRVLGEDYSHRLRSIGNLASTLPAEWYLEEARELELRVLEGMQRVLGEEHPDTLWVMGDLASTLYLQRNLEGAWELGHRVLEVRRRVLGEEHPDTLLAKDCLAETLTVMGGRASGLYVQGNLEGARELKQRVLERMRRVLGEEHSRTLMAMESLASMLQAQGNLEGAWELQQQVLEVRRRVLGEEHPDTLWSMGSLASILQAQGNLEGAWELGHRVLEVRRRVLGEEHPATLMAKNELVIMQRRGLKERMANFVRRMMGRSAGER
jgi:hypothetical protein